MTEPCPEHDAEVEYGGDPQGDERDLDRPDARRVAGQRLVDRVRGGVAVAHD
jgi:hypothetical protein